MPDYPRSTSSSFSSRKISSYPAVKHELQRVHAPVGNTRFKFFSWKKKSEVSADLRLSSPAEMGNLLGTLSKFEATKNIALDSLRYFKKDDSVLRPQKKDIQVIDSDEEKQGGSIIEGWKDESWDVESSLNLERKVVDYCTPKRDYSISRNVSSSNGKLDVEDQMRDLILLDQEDGSSGMQQSYNRLYEDTKKRSGKLSSIKYFIELGYQELWSRFKGKKAKKDLAGECFVPLSEEEESKVARALHNSSRRELLVAHENSNIDINGEKLQCLKPGAWLNDEVINIYLELLKERENRDPEKFLKCHFFNTFFYKKLISKDGYKSVRRWTTQKKLGYSLLDCDKIFVPIHQHNHWCLAVINKKEKKFQYLDSLGGQDRQVMDVLACYYVDEVKDKNGENIDVSSWEQEFVSDLPEQKNGYDCGVFMIKYADFYSRDIGLCFGQEHMPYFRRRTANEILKLRAD